MAFASFRNLKTQWFPPAPTFTDRNVPEQKGKVFIVTGGNSGVGYALVNFLYSTGATIYMASRSKEKAEKAIAEIEAATPVPKLPGNIKFLKLDLNDLLSVKAAAAEFSKQESKVDVLFNNAGIGARNVGPGARTAQGLDVMFGVHCVATLLFTINLLPQLRAASIGGNPARVVWTSSFLAEGASPNNGIDLKHLDSGYPDLDKNYAISKLLLSEPKFGAYTNLYAGFSTDITLENNGAYVIPWGRLRDDKNCPRKDIIKAMTDEEKGGLGYPKTLWEYCEAKWAESGV
ncbi:short-chain dehydrogenase protein [Rutstroemia sp. NJR-2017a BBW]|nr:short-chain dehydrogenase protein [Rutstroemia sp. NJR-2017a BBW]